jgi:outer membrane protein OmpA-like peptidoglycan-associated protein
MKKNFYFKAKKHALFIAAALSLCGLFAQGQGKTYDPNAPLAAKSKINWIDKTFTSNVTLDIDKAGIPMPSGKNSAVNAVTSRLPNLIKDPLLTIYVDSSRTLGDYILERKISLQQITDIIESGNKTLGYFENKSFLFKMDHKLNLNQVGSLFVRHQSPYSRRKSIETISSRVYTGIIIDARGKLPVHGEFVDGQVNPCLFPRVWNEKMEIVYERNMMESAAAKDKSICGYDWSDDESRYRSRVGADPIHITAKQIFGHNRTDLVISDDDALRIFSVPQNAELLKSGKIVLLLDKDVLVHDVAAPIKDDSYYTAYRNVKKYPLKKPGADSIDDGPDGIRFTYNLKFIADSPELLPEELPRIRELSDLLKEALSDNSFTIFVAGHTADIGQPENQMRLSIDRTQTIIALLIEQGIDKNLFSYRGYGETDPVGDNSTKEGRALNRRVVITLRPRQTYIQRSW